MKTVWFILSLVFGVAALLYLIDLMWVMIVGEAGLEVNDVVLYTIIPMIITAGVFVFSQSKWKKLKNKK